MSTTQRKPVHVMGYLASNWVGANDKNPTLILNPEATPLDMLAWCWAEIVALQATMNAISGRQFEIEPSDLEAIFQHRITPLASVMRVAVDELMAARDSDAEGV
ncbi:hypothetical protein [Polaromonas sp.]|uniref:hypothetical protein n=1 Tax=Polaromonas sp. TaxID=1869339 RepID=UPI0037538B35